MGVWGLGTDENDATYDAVGFDLMERVAGVSFVNPGQEDPRLEKLPADLRKNKPHVFDQPGVVILLLKLGCAVEVEAIQKAQSALELQLLALPPWRGDGITAADSPTGRASRQCECSTSLFVFCVLRSCCPDWNPGATGILPEHVDNPQGRKAAIDEETKLCEEAIANGGRAEIVRGAHGISWATVRGGSWNASQSFADSGSSTSIGSRARLEPKGLSSGRSMDKFGLDGRPHSRFFTR